MDNINLVLYEYIEQIRLNPDKFRRIVLLFDNINRPGQHNLLVIFAYRGSLVVRLNIPLNDRNIDFAEHYLGIQLLDIPENNTTILIFPMALNMIQRSTVTDRRTFVNIIISYIRRVSLVTRKILNRIDLYEYSPNNTILLHTHNVLADDPVRPLTPPRRP